MREKSAPKLKRDHLAASATHFGEKYNRQVLELREYQKLLDQRLARPKYVTRKYMQRGKSLQQLPC